MQTVSLRRAIGEATIWHASLARWQHAMNICGKRRKLLEDFPAQRAVH